MSKKSTPSNGTAIATVAPALVTITRSEANRMLKARAQERYHEARAQREQRIHQFETEYGCADRIDHTLLKDLQHLQVRFAAIAARQHTLGHDSEPKVSKFTRQLGEIIGELSAHLATDQVVALFARVEERDYLGVGTTIGRKGLDESILGGYTVVDDPLGPKNGVPTALEGDDVCLHEDVEPDEANPARGTCLECGARFELAASATVDHP